MLQKVKSAMFLRYFMIALLLGGMLAGCEDDSPMEEMGDNIEEEADELEDEMDE